MVVDLAVKGDHIAPVGASHGLMAGRREIESRQALMSKGHTGAGFSPHSGIIWTALAQRSRHGDHGRLKIWTLIGS